MPSERAANGSRARLLTLQEASAEYGPPYTSLRDLVIRGHLPSVRLGDSRRIWIQRKDIEALIARSIDNGDEARSTR